MIKQIYCINTIQKIEFLNKEVFVFENTNNWDIKKRSQLIESIFLNIPLKPIYVIDDKATNKQKGLLFYQYFIDDNTNNNTCDELRCYFDFNPTERNPTERKRESKNQKSHQQYEVIDGNKRLSTLFDFIENKFTLESCEFFPFLNNKKFNEFSTEEQKTFFSRLLSIVYIAINEKQKHDLNQIKKMLLRIKQN